MDVHDRALTAIKPEQKQTSANQSTVSEDLSALLGDEEAIAKTNKPKHQKIYSQ